LEIIIRAAHEYEATCFKEGRPPVVEEVLVCEPVAEVVRRVQTRVAKLAKFEAVVAPKAARKKAAGKPKSRTRKPAKPVLDPAEVSAVRHTAEKYSMRNTYQIGAWLQHPKFGIGRVEIVTDTQAIEVIFEGGETKKLAHQR
jgi:hypothetical protein